MLMSMLGERTEFLKSQFFSGVIFYLSNVYLFCHTHHGVLEIVQKLTYLLPNVNITNGAEVENGHFFLEFLNENWFYVHFN